MGLAMRMLSPRNLMQMRNMVKISSGMDLHMKKRCAYCDWIWDMVRMLLLLSS